MLLQKKPADLLRISLSGGLGNQLSIFSAGLIEAKGQGLEPILDLHWYAGFQRGARLPFHRRKFHLSEFSPRVRDFRKTWAPPSVDRIRRGFATEARAVSDWPRSHEFFQANRDFLLQTLAPDSGKESARQTHLSQLAGPDKKPLAIHVRLGDNVHPKTPNPVVGPRYFEEALQFFPLDEFTPIVFSDSPEICRTWDVFRDAVFLEENRPHHALRLMSLAGGFIGSLSTLSWWAAWLPGIGGTKTVMMPSFNLAAEFEAWKDFYDPLWTTLNDRNHILSRPSS